MSICMPQTLFAPLPFRNEDRFQCMSSCSKHRQLFTMNAFTFMYASPIAFSCCFIALNDPVHMYIPYTAVFYMCMYSCCPALYSHQCMCMFVYVSYAPYIGTVSNFYLIYINTT
jgi:hypothetical protein